MNELLKRTLEQERSQELAREAELFYEVANQGNRKEERAFQKAGLRSLTRE